MKKKIGIAILAVCLFGFLSYNYVMHGGERDLSSEETAFTVNVSSIKSEFSKNINLANKKYLEKPIAVSGFITAINGTQLTIDNFIICTLKKPKSTKIGQEIIVKGRVVGYDDLMEELKLDQCFIINNEVK